MRLNNIQQSHEIYSMRQVDDGQKKKTFLLLLEIKRNAEETFKEKIRNYPVDKSAGCRLYPRCRKIYQVQIPEWQDVQYFLFRVLIFCRQGNDRAGSEPLRYQLYSVEISM